LKLWGNWIARRSWQMRFVVNWQRRYLANGTRKKVFVGLCFSNGFRACGFLSCSCSLSRRNLLLNQLEILKRLEFHQPMLPQAAFV
jgi:hypothetical protein